MVKVLKIKLNGNVRPKTTSKKEESKYLLFSSYYY